MITTKIRSIQSSTTIPYFLILLALEFSNICEGQLVVNNGAGLHQNRSLQETFLLNGRHHELPTVSISSDRLDVKIVKGNNTWKLRETKKPISSNNDEKKLCSILVTATYPFHVFYERIDDDSVSNPLYNNERDSTNISDESSFQFKFRMSIYLSHMKWENNSFEFRSSVAPFFGISVRFFYDLNEEAVNIYTSPEIPDKFYDYLNWTIYGKEDEDCDARFIVQQSINPVTGKSQRMYDCVFEDGSRGLAGLYASAVNVVRINYEKFRASSKCLKLCENESLCLQEELWTPNLSLQWTVAGYCTLDTNEGPKKRIFFPPIYNSLPQGDTGETEIYFNLGDVKVEKIIKMNALKEYAYLNSVIEVTCTISDYFFATPLRFALQYKHSNNLEFLARVSDKSDYVADCDCRPIKYTLKLDNLNIERVFCFAPVVGSFDWINASRPIRVIVGSAPTFLHSSSDSNSEEIATKTFTVDREFPLGSENNSIACKATGEPLPAITWIRNHAALLESRKDQQPYKYVRSQLSFETMDKTAEGKYTCRATNDHGFAEAYINVIVPDHTNTALTLSVSLPIIAVLLIAGGAVIYTVVVMKSRGRIFLLTEQECQEFLNGSSNTNSSDPNSVIFAKAFDPKFVIPKNCLIIDNKNILGSGQFGIVTKGLLKTGDSSQLTVAIKTVKPSVDVMYLKALISEVKVMSYLEVHDNIAEFLGACIENINEGEVYAAVEFCDNGDLCGCLRKQNALLTTSVSIMDQTRDVAYTNTRGSEHQIYQNADSHLPPSIALNLLKWSRDISSGMAFISSKNVIHGDLAARNVLLTKDNVAKISDFGLSRQLLNDYTAYTKKSVVPLPWKWMALESLTCMNFSVHSDKWAFGMTLWEIFSLGESPYPGLTYDEHFVQKISTGFRCRKPQFANTEIYEIMLQCWHKDPMSRPDMSSVCNQFEEMLRANKTLNAGGNL